MVTLRRTCSLAALLCVPALLAVACSDSGPGDAATTAAESDEPEPGMLGRSSVLLVTMDTTRVDAFGCYGAPPWVTPGIDALAARGVRFQQARTTCPVTLPAHASILTGLYPFEHGVRDNATFVLDEGVETLPERLSAAGWSTGAVTGAFVVHSEFGLDQGFDVYADVPRRHLETEFGEDRRTAREVVDEALSLVQGGRLEPPFFLWVHMFDAHQPLNPPAEMLDLARSEIGEAELAATSPDVVSYLAAIASCDREISRLRAGLEQVVPADRLLVVVVADHGEGLGQHDEPAHGLQLFDTTLHVPLVMYHPLLAHAVVDTPVSTIDIAPTIHGLLGLGAIDGVGRDLTPLMRGGTDAQGRTLYFETAHPLYSWGWAPLYGMLSGSTKVIEGPHPEVYDLAADPGEVHDLFEEHPDVHARVRSFFPALEQRTRKSHRITLPDDDRDRLVQLGYTDGSPGLDADDRLLPGTIIDGLLDPREGLPTKILCQRAASYGTRKEFDKALEDMRMVLERDPDNPFFLSQAGRIYLESGHIEQALDVLTRSIARLEDAGTRCSLAVAQHELGRTDEAIDTLRENAALHPHHLHTRFALGELLLERGGEGDARAAQDLFDAFLAEYASEDGWKQRARELRDTARARE